MTIFSYFPGGNRSLTRKWMERNVSNRELVVTLIGTGILAAVANYYFERTFLVLGTVSTIVSNGLKSELKKPFISNIPENQALLSNSDNVSSKNKYVPLKMLRFAVLSAFIGKCVYESWHVARTPKDLKWAPYLFKIPFYYLTFRKVFESTHKELAAGISKVMFKVLSKDDIKGFKKKVVNVGFFAIATITVYLAPRLILLTGVIAIKNALNILYHILFSSKYETATNAKDIFSYLKVYIDIGVKSILIGAMFGKMLRSLSKSNQIDHTLPYSKLALFYSSLIIIGTYLMAFLIVYMSRSLNDLDREQLTGFANKYSRIDDFVMSLIRKMEIGVQRLNDLYSKTLEEIKQIYISLEEKNQQDLARLHELKLKTSKGFLFTDEEQEELDHLKAKIESNIYHSVFLGLLINLIEDNKSIYSSINKIKDHFYRFEEFYYTITGRKVGSFEPVDLTRLIDDETNQIPCQRKAIIEQEISNLNQRIEKINSRNMVLTKKQASYLLLVAENAPKAIVKKNYRAFILWTHPDKGYCTDDLPFKYVTEAYKMFAAST